MDKARIPFEMHIFQNGVHGLSLAKPVTSSGLRSMKDDQAVQWFGLCTAWLSQTFGEFASDADVILNQEIDEYSIDVQMAYYGKIRSAKERYWRRFRFLPTARNCKMPGESL